MTKMAELFKKIDVYVAPPFGDNLLLTNLTGHPAVVVPTGFTSQGEPTSLTFISDLYQEEKALFLAKIFQEATDFHLRHPDLSILAGNSAQKEN